MRSLIFRTAIAALFISTPFATAYAHGSHGGGGSQASHELGGSSASRGGRSVSTTARNFDRIERDTESDESSSNPSYLFGTHETR